MMRWLKRRFKKYDRTEERFRRAIEKIVPLNNSLVDIFNEIETITFHKSDDAVWNRPLDVEIKWRRSDKLSTFGINRNSSYDLDDEYLLDSLCLYLRDAYDEYREDLMKKVTAKMGDVIEDG